MGEDKCVVNDEIRVVGESVFVFFFKQKTAYEVLRSLVGSEMCIRDRFGCRDDVLIEDHVVVGREGDSQPVANLGVAVDGLSLIHI